jgi:hypothetical protein
MFANINILAIVAAAVAAWLFGAVWYRVILRRGPPRRARAIG